MKELPHKAAPLRRSVACRVYRLSGGSSFNFAVLAAFAFYRFAAPAAFAFFSWTVTATTAANQEAQKPERGEQIMNAACATCHDLRPIDTQALDEAGWTKEVKSMVEQGAEVKPDDLPVLIEYLSRLHGPLPDGPGKEILLDICTRCHDLQRVRRQRNTAEGWLETLDAMLNEGAPLTEKDLPVLLRYLARNFGQAPLF